MRLSRFIHENMQSILLEWDAFAKANAPKSAGMTDLALRDHAEEILEAIAEDIETPQNAQQQRRKSQGLSDRLDGRSDAASIHGRLRHESDFSLLQLTAEYRALRATVLRLWLPTVADVDADTAQEMVRFNEAIDQALAESVVAYDERASRTRELFLAILGHDLRSPLSTVELIGTMMSRQELNPQQAGELGDRLQRTSRMMSRMIVDLIGFTRVRLGGGLPVNRRTCNLAELLRHALADAQASYPATAFELHLADEVDSCWDGDRLHQVFVNLMVNAVQHGTRGTPVTIAARRCGDQVSVDVTNFGRPIRPESMESIFRPLVQHPDRPESTSHPTGSLGLGLYIAREITERHGGSIEVLSSDADGTTFRVTLPLSMECEPG